MPARSLRLSLLGFDTSGIENADFEVEIEGLGENLRPTRLRLAPLTPWALPETMHPVLDRQRSLAKARNEMGRRGADGTIDALALNAARHLGQLRDAMTGLAAADRFWLKDDTALT